LRQTAVLPAREHRAGSALHRRKETTMKESRVLSRLGARELTTGEVHHVEGSFLVHTNNCTALQTTGAGFGDGDGCGNDHDG
jgi:hypothetical protein